MNIHTRLPEAYYVEGLQKGWQPIATVYMPATWTYAAWTRWVAERFTSWVWVGNKEAEVER